MQCKKMFKMDFSFSFSLPCMLMILTIISGIICTANNSSFQNSSSIQQESMCAHPVNVCINSVHTCDKKLCLKDAILQSYNLSKEVDGKCFGNETSFLCVCDLLPTVQMRCLPDGKVSLSCEIGAQFNDHIFWTLNGSPIIDTDACIKDGGRKIILEKAIHGKFTCHRKNNHCRSSPIELFCNNGDLLQHPLFLYVLTACGGGAVLLAITASLITCCCMKTKHNFIQVPVEDEKDEGITMSAISSERPKSPPNGDHCEVTDVLVDSTPKTSAQTCESFKPDNKEDPNVSMGPEVKSESRREDTVGADTEFNDVMVDYAAQEGLEDCFPDPIDA